MTRTILECASRCHESTCSEKEELLRLATDSCIDQNSRIVLENDTIVVINDTSATIASSPLQASSSHWTASAADSVILDSYFKHFPKLKSKHRHTAAYLLDSISQGSLSILIENKSISSEACEFSFHSFITDGSLQYRFIDNSSVLKTCFSTPVISNAMTTLVPQENSDVFLQYIARVAQNARWERLSSAGHVALFEALVAATERTCGDMFKTNAGRLWIDGFCSSAQVRLACGHVSLPNS